MKHLAPLVAVLGAALVAAACGGSDEGTTATAETTTQTLTTTETEPAPGGPTTMRITVAGGVPEGGIVRESVERNDRVVVLVRSDAPDRVHVHGYDLFADVGPGSPARIAFRANLSGRFEIELEERHVQVAELTVGA